MKYINLLSHFFSKAYLIRYGVLFGMWVFIQIAASITTQHTIAQENQMLASLQPIPQRDLVDIVPPTRQANQNAGQRKSGRHVHPNHRTHHV